MMQMNKVLDIYLYGNLIGNLKQNSSGLISFKYNEEWLKESSFRRKECNGFFSGLLPEEEKRRIIAKNIGVSSENEFSLLEKIGGECAGAITFIKSKELPKEEKGYYRELSLNELENILLDLPQKPMLAGERGMRLSLAGAQDKIVVKINNGRIYLPMDGAPSTHIIKPAISRFSNIVYNEAFCLNLASKIGITAAEAKVTKIGKIDSLIIKRYDRITQLDESIERIHQEDFCQALGISPEIKYQNEGGVSLKNCFDLLRSFSSLPIMDIKLLLEVVIFNYLIGNNDAHGKNFSLLHMQLNNEYKIRLAPFYDLISTAVYSELSSNMAMKIGEHYEYSKIKIRDWEKFANIAQISFPILKKNICEMSQKILIQMPDKKKNENIADVVALIENRCNNTLDNF
jgi:serine/threonine-protein kinase HipA